MQSRNLILQRSLIVIIYYFIAGLIVMLLWNWLLPSIFGLKVISYWEACGLILLINFLFSRTFIRKYIMRRNCENERWSELCDDKKEKLNMIWEERCREIQKDKP